VNINIQSKINKILLALKVKKGIIIKIDTQQFYSEEKQKVFTKHIVYEDHPKNGEVFYSKVEMLKYLVNLYKGTGDLSG
jgi:hypothetical protein